MVVQKLLCPFSGPSANAVRVNHAAKFVHVPHVPYLVLYYCQLHSFAMLITEITFSGGE
jgi:hypothetical protein